MPSNPVPFTGVMTRSMSISQQQLNPGVVPTEHESNATEFPINNLPISPITQLSSPENPFPNHNQFTSPYTTTTTSSSQESQNTSDKLNSFLPPSDISTRLEDTLERNNSTPNNKNSSIDSSSFLSQLQLIGSETENRIRNSQNSVQQQIAVLMDKHEQTLLLNSKLFEQMSTQINNTSSALDRLIQQLPQLLITQSITPLSNTSHANPSSSMSSDISIFHDNSSSSSSSSSSDLSSRNALSIHTLSIKEINYIMENSIPIKISPENLKLYCFLPNNVTPAGVLHNHEEVCDLYNIDPRAYVQLILTNLRKNSPELYEAFLQNTLLPRAQGKSKFNNPTC